MLIFHITFTQEDPECPGQPLTIAEQSHIRAESLWHLLRILATDFREEMDTCTGLVIGLQE
jgi:hypothetical protein